MSVGRNPVLYGSGLFDDPRNPTVDEVASSGFTTVILWTLHVSENGDFAYNDTPAVKNGTVESSILEMKSKIEQLKSDNVQNVLFCIGSADVHDFRNMKNLLNSSGGAETLRTNFSAIANALDIDGFDFDLEEFDEDYTETVVQLTLMLNGIGKKQIITYCPFTDQNMWNDCLSKVYSQNGSQLVSWLNLQCYSGGSGNSPKHWAEQIPQGIGIGNPSAFVIPGYDGGASSDPICIQNTFSTLRTQDPGINGGFIWNSTSISKSNYKPVDFATAIIAGLNGTD